MEDAAFLTWREFSDADRGVDPAKKLNDLVARARASGGRFLQAAFPSDLRNGAEQGLEALGFKHVGQLADYYEPGVHQVHWVLRLRG